MFFYCENTKTKQEEELTNHPNNSVKDCKDWLAGDSFRGNTFSLNPKYFLLCKIEGNFSPYALWSAAWKNHISLESTLIDMITMSIFVSALRHCRATSIQVSLRIARRTLELMEAIQKNIMSSIESAYLIYATFRTNSCIKNSQNYLGCHLSHVHFGQ